MTTKSAFPALYALISPAWERGSPRVEDLALPKSLKSGNFTLAKAVIRWMSEYCFSRNGKHVETSRC
jgi:hypothetical protein